MIVVDGGLALMVNDPTRLDMTLARPSARKSALMSVSKPPRLAAERVVAAVCARQKRRDDQRGGRHRLERTANENGGRCNDGSPR